MLHYCQGNISNIFLLQERHFFKAGTYIMQLLANCFKTKTCNGQYTLNDQLVPRNQQVQHW